LQVIPSVYTFTAIILIAFNHSPYPAGLKTVVLTDQSKFGFSCANKAVRPTGGWLFLGCTGLKHGDNKGINHLADG